MYWKSLVAWLRIRQLIWLSVVLHFAIAGQFLQCSGVNNSSVCYAPLIMDDLSYHMCKMYY
jgi:hypothetical protein